MNLLSAENISKSYSEKQLLDDIGLGISEGDKIGLIGVNGTGKTTLLKIIAGIEKSDTGRIIMGNSISIGYLAQNPCYDIESTVLEQVFAGSSPEMNLIRKYEEAVNNRNTPGESVTQLIHEMDTLNAWNMESDAKAILTRLGIFDFDAKIGTLSGGQRKRVAIASALIKPSDLLIMDEPTNHLDNDTIDWLEQYLKGRKGALFMVTHDRYFLDRIANRIIELDGGRLYEYKGSYSVYLEKKIEREELEAASERKRQNLLKKELAWIKRGAKARSTKQKARIERFEALNSKAETPDDDRLEISVAGSRLGRKVIELEHVNKCFDNIKVIDDFTYTMLRNDRVGIIGPNGSGKTTLLNIICGLVKQDSGTVDVGETVKIGLYSQEGRDIDDNLRVIEYIKQGAEVLTTAEGYKISASQMLEMFLFPPSLQWSLVGKLSGGEKRRLYLLRVLMESPNVLLLDEPTNDLDIETLTILEDYLDSFQGAVIAVSHDRYFLDRIAEKVFSFEGNGRIVQYTGNYTSFKEERVQSASIRSSSEDNVDKTRNDVDKRHPEGKKDRPLRFSFKEQKEYGEIDSIIMELENKIKEIDMKINEASTDYSLLQDLLSEKEEVEEQLRQKMDRWVYLNELAEAIAKEKQ